VFGRPPPCGLRKPRRNIVRTVATDVRRQQCEGLSTATRPVPASPMLTTSRCATNNVDEQLSINLLNIGGESSPSSSSVESTAPRKKHQPPRSAAARSQLTSHVNHLSASTHRRLRPPELFLDNVDLWENSTDSELVLETAAESATTDDQQIMTSITDTCSIDKTTGCDNSNEQTAKRAKESCTWCKNTNDHVSSSQQKVTTTAAVDARTQNRNHESRPVTAAAARVSRRFIPSIVESYGRPATSNRCAVDLSNGSVELCQRRNGSGLELFIRGMRLKLARSREQKTRSEVKVTHLNDITSSQ